MHMASQRIAGVISFLLLAMPAIGLVESASSSAGPSMLLSAPRNVALPAANPKLPLTLPRSVSAEAGQGEITVSWEAPEHTGRTHVVRYVVTASSGHTRSTPGHGRSVTIPIIPNGRSVTATVTATTLSGESSTSDPSEPVVPYSRHERLSGHNRYATAAAISTRFPGDADTVFIASGLDFPDALAGAALAGHLQAPLLLSRPDEVPQETLEAIGRLQPSNIILLGGEPTLAKSVAVQLREFGVVTRIAGQDRYSTAAMIAREFGTGVDTLYIASGQDYPDALAGAAVGGATGSPVLLTNPRELPTAVREAVEFLAPEEIVVLGGTPSVSSAVESELRELGAVERVAGTDRYDTAAQVASRLGTSGLALVASGINFPDALSGAALAGASNAPILLVRREQAPAATLEALGAIRAEGLIALGDVNAVGIGVYGDVVGALTWG